MKVDQNEVRYLCLKMGFHYFPEDIKASLDLVLSFIQSDSMNERNLNLLKETCLGKKILADLLYDKTVEYEYEKGDCFGDFDSGEDECKKMCSMNYDCEEFKEMINKKPTTQTNKEEDPMHTTEKKPETAAAPAPAVDPIPAVEETKSERKVEQKKAPKTKKAAEPKKVEQKKAPAKAAEPKTKKKVEKAAAPAKEKKEKVVKEKAVKVKKEKVEKVALTPVPDLLKPLKVTDVGTAYSLTVNGCSLFMRRKADKSDGKSVGIAVPKTHKEWIEDLKAVSTRYKNLAQRVLLVVPAEKLVGWVNKTQEKK